jgi:hypothetical protein
VALAGQVDGPFGEQAGEAAGLFVVAGHAEVGAGAVELLALGGGDGIVEAGMLQQLHRALRVGLGMDAGRAEEDHGVLDALPAKAGEGLVVFRQDAQQAAVGTLDKALVLVGQGRGAQGGFVWHRDGPASSRAGDSILKARAGPRGSAAD